MSVWTIYSAICAVNGKEYVGLTRQKLSTRVAQHFSNARRGKDTFFHRAIRSYGQDSFCFSVVVVLEDYDAAIQAERDTIALRGTLSPGGYNLTVGGDGVIGSERSEETKLKIGAISSNRPKEVNEKISKTLSGRPLSEERREKARLRGCPQLHTPEARAKAKAGIQTRGNHLSPESRRRQAEKSSVAMKGRKKTPEHAAAISAGRKGMKFTPEHCANIVAAIKRRPPRSQEHIEKHAAALRGRKNSPQAIENMKAAAKLRAAKRRAQT